MQSILHKLEGQEKRKENEGERQRESTKEVLVRHDAISFFYYTTHSTYVTGTVTMALYVPLLDYPLSLIGTHIKRKPRSAPSFDILYVPEDYYPALGDWHFITITNHTHRDGPLFKQASKQASTHTRTHARRRW